jgi:hypothetical protein
MPTIQEMMPQLPMPMGDGPLAGFSDILANVANVLLMPANAVLSLISGATEMGKRERFAGRTGIAPEHLASEISARQLKTRRVGFSTEGDTIMF